MLPRECVESQSKCPVSLPWSNDDEETDPEMPQLVPCRIEKTLPKLLRKRRLSFRKEAAQTSAEDATSETQMGVCNSITPHVPPAVGSSEVRTSLELNASSETQPIGAFRLGGAAGKLFGPRANALAEALDSLQKSSDACKPIDGSAMERSSVSGSLEVSACKLEEDSFVECSAASERLLRRDRDELDLSFEGGDESSSSEENDDEASTRSSKRRKMDGPNDVPPGAPSVAPAALAVAAAAATFPLESCGRRWPKVAENATLAKKADTSETLGNETAFGPRFHGLCATELEKARSSWSLHSLADVRTMSSDENRRAAARLLVDLRKRRNATSDSTEVAPAAGDEGPCKPKFRKRSVVLGDDSTQHTSVTDGKDSRPLAGGGRVMQECLAGSGPRRRDSTAACNSLLACNEDTEDTIEQSEVSEPAFSKRSDLTVAKGRAARAAKRVTCTSLDEGDDTL